MPEVSTLPATPRRVPASADSFALLLSLAPDTAVEDHAFAQALAQAPTRQQSLAAARALALAVEPAPLPMQSAPASGAVADAVADAFEVEGPGRHARPHGRESVPVVPTPTAAVQAEVATLPALRQPEQHAVHFPTRASRAGRHHAAARRTHVKRPAVAFLAIVGVLAAAQTSASEGSAVAKVVANAAARASTGADIALEGTSRSGTRTGVGMPSASDAADSGPTVAATPILSAASEHALERSAVVADEGQARATAAAEAAAAAAAAVAAEEAAAAEAARRLEAPMSTAMVSGFGFRADPFGNGVSAHEGLDYAAGCGAEIHAAGGGTVVESGWMGGYGWRVVIDHGVIDGHALKSTYNHMGSPGVSVGTVVTKGQVLGFVGSTGASTGCHLHFEIKQDGTLVDPAGILPHL